MLFFFFSFTEKTLILYYLVKVTWVELNVLHFLVNLLYFCEPRLRKARKKKPDKKKHNKKPFVQAEDQNINKKRQNIGTIAGVRKELIKPGDK